MAGSHFLFVSMALARSRVCTGEREYASEPGARVRKRPGLIIKLAERGFVGRGVDGRSLNSGLLLAFIVTWPIFLYTRKQASRQAGVYVCV